MAFNLPTGASRLNNSELGAKMDQDLVLLPIFGEGFGVNPSLNLSKNIGMLTIGWGIGYNWKFAYDPTADIDNDDVQPANILNTNLGVKMDLTKRFSISWDFIYSSSGRERLNEDPYADQGERFEFQWGTSYNLDPILLNAGINYRFQNMNRITDSSGNFTLEEKNSNPDELIIDTEIAYRVKPFIAKVKMQHKYLTANNYSSDNSRYDGGRYRLLFGPKIEYPVRQKGTLSFEVKYLYMHDDEDARGAETFYNGFQLLFGGSMRF